MRTTSVQISFRKMACPPDLEHEIRSLADQIATASSRLVRCRVLVETPHRHRQHGRSIHVRVELSFPGEDVIVNRHVIPGAVDTRSGARWARSPHDDVRMAVQAAFDIARRRVVEVSRALHGR